MHVEAIDVGSLEREEAEHRIVFDRDREGAAREDVRAEEGAVLVDRAAAFLGDELVRGALGLVPDADHGFEIGGLAGADLHPARVWHWIPGTRSRRPRDARAALRGRGAGGPG